MVARPGGPVIVNPTVLTALGVHPRDIADILMADLRQRIKTLSRHRIRWILEHVAALRGCFGTVEVEGNADEIPA